LDRVSHRWQNVAAAVIRGHRVASGLNADPRFPGGTLAMQLPHFHERGLDLGGFFLSTLNLSIDPARYEIVEAKHTFRQVAWHSTEPAEDFSFFDCQVRRVSDANWTDGLIYYPHPETKPEHFQPPGLLEVIATEKIDGINYGDPVELRVDSRQIRLLPPENPPIDG
jgi:hypothetical protein